VKRNKLNHLQQRLQTRNEEKEILNRFYHRNWKAMIWCNKQGLTIYVSAQSGNSNIVKIFVQKGVPFKPLNNIEYNQEEPEDVIKYTAAIDAEYERLYTKMKHRV